MEIKILFRAALICLVLIPGLGTRADAQGLDGVWQAWVEVKQKMEYSASIVEEAISATTDQERCQKLRTAYSIDQDAASHMMSIVNDTRAPRSGNMDTYEGGRAAIEKIRDDAEKLIKTYCVPFGY